MNLILTTREEADQQFLMHYRTAGSKNGQRLYQNKDGSLTPLGRMHYAAMYGWGKKRAMTKADKAEVKAQKAEMQAEQKRIKADRLRDKENQPEKSEREMNKEMKAKIQAFNERTKTAAEERAKDATAIDNKGKETSVPSDNSKEKTAIVRKTQLKEMQESIKNARNMSDDELNKALNRLRMEKQYAELLNERANREKGPVAAMASKLFQDAAQDLAKKALTVVVDKVIDKAKSSTSFKLADYKNVDPYSLSSDKLKAVAEAFNNAANLARNRNVVNNGGKDPNQGGGNNGNNQPDQQQNKGKDKKDQQSQNNQQNKADNKPNEQPNEQQNQNGDGSGLSKNQRKKMRAMANSGKSAAEIAKQFGVSESTVRQYAGEQLKSNSTQGSSDSGSKPSVEQKSAPEPKQEKPVNATVDRSEQNRSYMSAASSNRKLLQKNLSTTTRNIDRANKFFDSFAKEAKVEADEKAKQERLSQFSNWVNGAEWSKEKVRIQKEQAREQAERAEKNRKERLRMQARMFGYRV